MSNLQFVYNSDLLECDSQIIAQQYNCTSKKCKGLAADISEKFPYADFYSARIKKSIPGTIKVVGNKKRNERFICAMFAQKNPGNPKEGDSFEQREEWFKICLEKIAKIKGLKSIAFPYKIGCGLLAGGCWENYLKMLEEWSNTVPNVQVKIISKEDAPGKSLNYDDLTCEEKLKLCDTIWNRLPDIHMDEYMDELLEDVKNSRKKKATEKSKNQISDTKSVSIFDSIFINHTKCVTEKIKKLNVHQKAKLFDHVFSDINADIIMSSSKVIDEILSSGKISLDKGENVEFILWAWNHMKEMNIPFINLDYFSEEYSRFFKKEEVIEEIEENEKYEDEEDISWKNTTLLEYTKNNIPEGWENFFEDIIENEGLDDLSDFLEKESSNYTLYPPLPEIYTAFEYCPPDSIKAIFIGQDPYHMEGAAMGIAFGHHSDRKQKPQPSLRIIYDCLEKDGYKANRDSGDLSYWCAQGVFLINTALTVREKDAGSHAKTKVKEGPWDYFTGQLFRYLDDYCDHLVVVMWGLKAQAYESFFSTDKHFIIKAPHPVNSVYRPDDKEFLEHKPFTQINKKLKKWGKEEIDWNL